MTTLDEWSAKMDKAILELGGTPESPAWGRLDAGELIALGQIARRWRQRHGVTITLYVPLRPQQGWARRWHPHRKRDASRLKFAGRPRLL